jgi:predicted acyl esterase
MQWMAAAQFPPHLAAIVPSVSTCPGTDFPMRGQIFPAWMLQLGS